MKGTQRERERVFACTSACDREDKGYRLTGYVPNNDEKGGYQTNNNSKQCDQIWRFMGLGATF